MKFVRVFAFVFFLTTFYILHTTSVYADECSNIDPNEFHSLRPYPGKPCLTAVSETATFCGDSLSLIDNIKITYNPDTDKCVSIPGGKVSCTYIEKQNKKIKIELSEAELPIMGNTEDVTPNASPDMPDAQKVNEYVSWYLNGVINRAEYLFLSWNNPDNIKKIINFSGPIKKLLPQRIQDDAREKQVKDAGIVRHNQIVACTYGVNLPIPIFGGQIGAIPGPCVDLGFIGNTLFKKERRLIGGEYLGDTGWKNHLPPKREEYSTYDEYYKAYRAWRGDKCYSLPIPFLGGLEIMLCFDNPLHPNFYGDLYPYIPFSSTEDRKGEVTASGSVGSPSDVTISNVSTSFTNATLYFAHMQEATELASTLQDTFVYKGADKFAGGNSVPVNTAGSCKIVDVRSGPGDSLLPNPSSITGKIAYTATFTCDFDPPGSPCKICLGKQCILSNTPGCDPKQDECRDGNDCPIGSPPPMPPQTCTKVIPITINTTTETPLADKIWAQLVSGNSSVFRRIFPKLGSGSQIGEVKDIPASTKVTYSGDVSGTGELKFPHIGGISEYFLKGIQTMLRPKGYGEAISFGEGGGIPGGKCKEDVPDSAMPAKYLGAFKSNIINLANNWSAKCPGPDNNLAEECYNYVVTESAAKGLNPAFALTIWLNESGASNYCYGDNTTQDFGVNLPSLYKNLVGQLNKFAELPNAFSYCRSIPGFVEPMHAFLSRFQSSSGACNPSDPVATKYYTDVRDTTWSWVSGCSTVGIKFGLSWPTDNSCP